MLAFTRRLIRLRRSHVVLHRSRFFLGDKVPGTEVKDVVWLRPDGKEMTRGDWGFGPAKALGLLLSGEAGLMHLTRRGDPEPDDTFLLLLNAGHEPLAWRLPPVGEDRWRLVVSTAQETAPTPPARPRPLRRALEVPPRTLLLLMRVAAERAER
jgi:glycogen operon protein